VHNTTREIFNRFLDQQAALNGVPVDTIRNEKAFSIEPSVQQRLIDRQGESSEFLSRVNVTLVDEMKGDVLGLGVTGPIARRTNTNANDRPTSDPTGLNEKGYECAQTNSDTHVGYAKLDVWAKFPDFQVRIRDHIVRQQARDRIMVGWNGLSAAAETNPVANPNLEDLNVGWLEYLRQGAPQRVLDEGDVQASSIVVGAFGDYKNLDALAWDAAFNLLPSWARQDPELVVVVGDGLLHDKYFPMVNQNLDPTEKLAADIVVSQKQIGGKTAVTVPFFPSNSMLITRLDNLSLYEQRNKRRRTIVDNAKRNRIETYESSNDAYVIEDFDFACLIENIVIDDEAGAPAGP
jgi:P2 family phage major capsid protein